MAGFPIVISQGRGIPVVHSDKAPSATVAANGMGLAVHVVSDRGIPLNFIGDEPVTPTPPDNFTMDAGSSGEFTGYYTTITGSIDPEPLPGFPMEAFITRGYVNIAFTGNCLDKLIGWVPSVEGIDLGSFVQPWTYYAESNSTECILDGTDYFANGVSYNVTWVQGV